MRLIRRPDGAWRSSASCSKEGGASPARCTRRRFYFQAEDGIRDYKVTGVQTCALPISDAWERRERWIVLDLLQCTLARRRHFHTRVEDSHGVEGLLHEREAGARIIEPDAFEQRCSQSAVAVLAGECPAQSRHELRDFIEEMSDTTPPVGRGDVDEWIDVDVSVARVPEDHAAESVARETLANAADVFGESRRWYGAILDELH